MLPPEVGETFAENALPKARAAAAATGRAAIADDSGIEAQALGGRSRRALGPLRGSRRHRRGEPREADARGFPRAARCATCASLAYVDPEAGEERRVLRRVPAATARGAPRGSGGFGYDPAFLPDEYPDGRTMAELSDEEKDAISHRGRAVRALARVAQQRRFRPTAPLPQVDRGGRGHRAASPTRIRSSPGAEDQHGDQAREDGREPGEPTEIHGPIRYRPRPVARVGRERHQLDEVAGRVVDVGPRRAPMLAAGVDRVTGGAQSRKRPLVVAARRARSVRRRADASSASHEVEPAIGCCPARLTRATSRGRRSRRAVSPSGIRGARRTRYTDQAVRPRLCALRVGSSV